MTTGKTIALTRRTLVSKVMSLLLNMLSSSTLATSCEELTHWKRLWCWEGLGAGGERDDRGWDGWMASLTQWTWIWVNSRSWWWIGRPGVLQFMGSQRVGHDWVTELNWTEAAPSLFCFNYMFYHFKLPRISCAFSSVLFLVCHIWYFISV